MVLVELYRGWGADEPVDLVLGRGFIRVVTTGARIARIAGHFAICHTVDTTSGRSFLEPDATNTDLPIRELLGDLIAAFIAAGLSRLAEESSLDRLVKHRTVRYWDRR